MSTKYLAAPAALLLIVTALAAPAVAQQRNGQQVGGRGGMGLKQQEAAREREMNRDLSQAAQAFQRDERQEDFDARIAGMEGQAAVLRDKAKAEGREPNVEEAARIAAIERRIADAKSTRATRLAKIAENKADMLDQAQDRANRARTLERDRRAINGAQRRPIR